MGLILETMLLKSKWDDMYNVDVSHIIYFNATGAGRRPQFRLI